MLHLVQMTANYTKPTSSVTGMTQPRILETYLHAAIADRFAAIRYRLELRGYLNSQSAQRKPPFPASAHSAYGFQFFSDEICPRFK